MSGLNYKSITFSRSSTLLPWIVVLTAASFAFLINSAINFNVISIYLTTKLNLSPTSVGSLFACYYYTNILFVFFAGIILDKISAKKILIFSFLVANCSILIFALTKSFIFMAISRLALGIVGSFSMLTTFKVIKTWFPIKKIALVTGVATTFANLGVFLSQTPFMSIVNKFGWQTALLMNFWLGILLLVPALILTYDLPTHHHSLPYYKTSNITSAFVQIVTNRQNWIMGFYGSLVNLPALFFGASWGILYLQSIKHFSELESSSIISGFVMGIIIGPFIIGWISNVFNTHKLLMFLCMLFSFICLALIGSRQNLSLPYVTILFFILGIMLSSQVMIFPLVYGNNPSHLTNTATGFVAALTAISGLHVQFLSYLMNYYNTKGSLASGYNISIGILIGITAINMFLVLLIKGKESSPNK